MTSEQKKWIDEASYTTLLSKWRFASLGDEIFQGSHGKYFAEVMFRKKAELSHEEQVAASKFVGWEK